jgi:hypothetical protein
MRSWNRVLIRVEEQCLSEMVLWQYGHIFGKDRDRDFIIRVLSAKRN